MRLCKVIIVILLTTPMWAQSVNPTCKQFTISGNWVQGVTYASCALVRLPPCSYISRNTTNSRPPNSAWQTLACDGTNGTNGTNGAQGPAGPVGATGATGPMGPQGQAGATGPAGAPGAQGPQGVAGPTGAAGPVGPIGPVGPQGPSGPAGQNGTAGAAGPMGPQGPAGPQIPGLSATGKILTWGDGTSGWQWVINSGGTMYTCNPQPGVFTCVAQ